MFNFDVHPIHISNQWTTLLVKSLFTIKYSSMVFMLCSQECSFFSTCSKYKSTPKSHKINESSISGLSLCFRYTHPITNTLRKKTSIIKPWDGNRECEYDKCRLRIETFLQWCSRKSHRRTHAFSLNPHICLLYRSSNIYRKNLIQLLYFIFKSIRAFIK